MLSIGYNITYIRFDEDETISSYLQKTIRKRAYFFGLCVYTTKNHLNFYDNILIILLVHAIQSLKL